VGGGWLGSWKALVVGRVVAVVLCILVAVVVSAAAAAEQFPPSVYPPAVKSHGILPGCPNPAGLEAFDASATRLALRGASAYDRESLQTDLRDSDRSWWSAVRAMWRTGKPEQAVTFQVVEGSQSLESSGYAPFVRSSCGRSLVAMSLIVDIGPRETATQHCEACISQLFFVDRRGHALVYYLY